MLYNLARNKICNEISAEELETEFEHFPPESGQIESVALS